MAGDVDEVKQKADIVNIIGERVELKKAGRNFKANCPFHSEKTPSFMVSSELGIYKCFGCGESGDVISFIQKYEGLDFPEALSFLAEKVGVKLKPRNISFDRDKSICFEVNELAKKYYKYLLNEHKSGESALNYLLTERGLKTKTIEEFELGYSPNDPKIFHSFFVTKKKINPKDLELSGLSYFRGERAFDRFFGRVIFPLHDHRGKVVGFSGRTLPGAKKDLAKYINTPETPVYHKSNILYALNINKEEIKKDDQCVLVEGELDVLTPWQVGVKNVVAIKGSALTENQVRLISRFTKNLVFALDTDLAGNNAARRGIEIAKSMGMKIRVADLGSYKDPDDMARAAPESLKKAINKSIPVYDYLVQSVIGKFDVKSGEGVTDASRELVPILSSIEDEIAKAKYVNIVADKLGVPYDSVFAQVDKVPVRQKKTQQKEVYSEAKKDRRDLLEENIVAMSFLDDPKKYITTEFLKLLSQPVLKKSCKKFIDDFSKKKKFDLEKFVGSLPNELRIGFSEVILKYSLEFDKYSASEAEREINGCIKQIELIDLKDEQLELVKHMKEYERDNKTDALRKANVRFKKIVERRRLLGMSEKR